MNRGVEQKRVEDIWAERTGVNRYGSLVDFFRSKSTWLYNIPDTHAINVTTPLSDMLPTQILIVTPALACHLHSAHGHTSF